MNKDEYEAAGLYMCDGCGRTYDSEIALIWRCTPTHDQATFKPHWEQD